MVTRAWNLGLTESEHGSITHSEADHDLVSLQIIVDS